jgi:uncharacterized protein (TIGR03067 family)
MNGDLEKLQGTWTIVDLEVEGRAMPGGSRVVLEGDRFTTIAMGSDYGGTVELNSAKSPKTFDLLFTSGPHKGAKSLGVYELDGDTWRICLAFAGIKTRPKEFATKPGSGFALETLRRGDLSLAGEPSAEADAGPPTELEGDWEMVSGSFDGYPMQASLVKQGRRTARGNRLTVMFGGQVYMKARVTLDSSTSPKQIDYAVAAGVGAGTVQLGIYEMDEKKLKLCMSPAGQSRPNDFTSVKGDGRTLTVWKRGKTPS